MPENKRRIMIGNFVLSSGFYDAYFKEKANRLVLDHSGISSLKSVTSCSPQFHPALKLAKR